jgi:transposase-like protein
MNLHKNARLTPQGRLLLVRQVTEQGWTVGAAAGAAGLAERQAFRWLARYRAGGTAALVDRGSAPKRCPHEVPAARVAAIEHWRRQRLSGPAIARQLDMPVSTVGGILRRLGLGKLAALEPKPPIVRYQRERPGELLHIDTKKLGRIEAVGHRITGAALRAAHRGRPWEPAARRDSKRGAGWEAVHVCIDDASRLAYSEVLPDERKASAVPFLERAVGWLARHGARRSGPTSVVGPGSQARVERVMTDNGSAYRSHHWRQACGELGLRPIRTRPYTPRTILGSEPEDQAERFIQTSLREWTRACPRAGASRTRGRALTRPRTSAPTRCSLGSTTTTARGRTLPWRTGRRLPGWANRRSSVRPTAPFLRPDLPSPTTGPPGRRQERRRRPAPAGAKRPCAAPPDRSPSNWRETLCSFT